MKRNFYELAEEDLIWAENMLLFPDPPSYNQIALLARQSAEKYLKHMQVLNGLFDFSAEKQTHNISLSRRTLERHGFSEMGREKITEACAFLDNYRTNIEYPGDNFLSVSSDDAENSVNFAKIVKDVVDYIIIKKEGAKK